MVSWGNADVASAFHVVKDSFLFDLAESNWICRTVKSIQLQCLNSLLGFYLSFLRILLQLENTPF